MGWPGSADELGLEQARLAAERPPATYQHRPDRLVGGCFVCFDPADRAFAGAAVLAGRRVLGTALATDRVVAAYEPGLLALREGPVLAAAVRRLRPTPDVLLVNATGLDHPRRAGLAIHLGAVLDLPTVGVTHRPLLACGGFGRGPRGSGWPVTIDREVVGRWLVTRTGARPVVVHPGWRVSLEVAVGVVLGSGGRARTPEPVRRAREVARRARRRYH